MLAVGRKRKKGIPKHDTKTWQTQGAAHGTTGGSFGESYRQYGHTVGGNNYPVKGFIPRKENPVKKDVIERPGGDGNTAGPGPGPLEPRVMRVATKTFPWQDLPF